MWPSQRIINSLAATLTLVCLCSVTADAAEQELQLDVSRGQLVSLPEPAGTVFVADPNIAGVQVPSDRQVFVFGKKAGETTLYALREDGKQITSMTITVKEPIANAQSAVDTTASPGTTRISGATNGAVLRGNVATPETGYATAHAAATALSKEQPLQNEAKVLSSAQVTLRVRIAEVDRSVIKVLGFNWADSAKLGNFAIGPFFGRQAFSTATQVTSTTGATTSVLATPAAFLADPEAGSPGSLVLNGVAGGFAAQNVIDALAEEGLVTLLAEPTLTAMSGETASFLAGGEFPIPIAQAGNGNSGTTITVEFKQFGVSLNFVPTVIAANRLNLHVKPEVSQLITATGGGAVQVGSLIIPALSVRRADTTIELGSGESFAIAGLMQNQTNTDVSNFPGLADLPILGPLFRSTHFTRNESELVVIVTPYITEPVADPHGLKLPTDGLAPANDLDRILRGRVAARTVTGQDGMAAAAADAPHLAGDAGFDIE